MAISLRPDEEQDRKLKAFMTANGHKTKNKALIWLIENSERLIESDKILNAIADARKQKLYADEMLANHLHR